MNNQVTVLVSDICTSQDWAENPDLIEITIDAAFIEKAKVAVEFLIQHEMHMVMVEDGFGYALYAESDGDGHDPDECIEHEQTTYAEFEPEFSISGCNAKVFHDGMVRAVFPFEHTGDEIWCDVGSVEALSEMLNGKAA